MLLIVNCPTSAVVLGYVTVVSGGRVNSKRESTVQVTTVSDEPGCGAAAVETNGNDASITRADNIEKILLFAFTVYSPRLVLRLIHYVTLNIVLA